MCTLSHTFGLRQASSSVGIVLPCKNKLEVTETALFISPGPVLWLTLGKSSSLLGQKFELPPSELGYSPHLPTRSHSSFRNLDLFTSGQWWPDAPLKKRFQNPCGWLGFPIPHFSSACLDFFFCSVLPSCKNRLLLARPFLTHTHHTCTRTQITHTQTSRQSTGDGGRGVGNERSPSQQVF